MMTPISFFCKKLTKGLSVTVCRALQQQIKRRLSVTPSMSFEVQGVHKRANLLSGDMCDAYNLGHIRFDKVL
eukprot:364930-Chlamydomonas_euryale.AAC.7